MKDEAAGWSEPTPQRLVEAMDSYDHVRRGGAPRSPIENGLKLLMRIEEQQDVSLGTGDRSKVVPALARAMDLDDELPKARVTSMMSARMIAVDVSLQRDAAMASDMDVLDRRQWWSLTDANARRPAWLLTSLDLSRTMRSLDETTHEAVAAGDFHAVPGRFGAKIKSELEGLRSVGNHARRDLDVDLMRAAGAISQDVATRLKGRLSTSEGRGEVFNRIALFSRQAMVRDANSWPDSDRKHREWPNDSQKIAFRLADTLRSEPAGPEAPLTSENRTAARYAVSDAGLSHPETESGAAVRIARTVLSDIGVDGSLLEGEAFERITALALRDSTSHAAQETMTAMAATRIAAMTLMRDEAEKRMARMDLAKGFPSGTERTQAFETMRQAGVRNRGLGVDVTMSESPRDRADLERISEGRFEQIGDALGLRSNVSNAMAATWKSSKLVSMVANETSVMHAGREAEERRRIAERPDGSMSKGPYSGKDWIADMAGFARDLGPAAR